MSLESYELKSISQATSLEIIIVICYHGSLVKKLLTMHCKVGSHTDASTSHNCRKFFAGAFLWDFGYNYTMYIILRSMVPKESTHCMMLKYIS